ncbi:MAG: DUF5615 family PIN-like protein [Armatimonadota bacterium]
MNWYVDESVERRIVDALRSAGHDVVAASEAAPGTRDEDVLLEASSQDRLLITNDTDFGWLVFARGLEARGILLLRLSAADSRAKATRLMQVLPDIRDRVAGHFVVIEDDAIRIRPLELT